MGRTPTIWCTIQRVQARPSWGGVRMAVTVGDREGAAVTLVLRPADLATYPSVQAAVLRATGSPFRSLPTTGPRGAMVAQPAALTRIAGGKASRHVAHADDGGPPLDGPREQGAWGRQHLYHAR
jgi:hypothetical protein